LVSGMESVQYLRYHRKARERFPATAWEKVLADDSHSLGIRAGGVYAWGSNANGRTGHGTTDGNTLSPTRVEADE
jgi:alpha-tubulin suppressor-like RCC1 family protein